MVMKTVGPYRRATKERKKEEMPETIDVRSARMALCRRARSDAYSVALLELDEDEDDDEKRFGC